VKPRISVFCCYRLWASSRIPPGRGFGPCFERLSQKPTPPTRDIFPHRAQEDFPLVSFFHHLIPRISAGAGCLFFWVPPGHRTSLTFFSARNCPYRRHPLIAFLHLRPNIRHESNFPSSLSDCPHTTLTTLPPVFVGRSSPLAFQSSPYSNDSPLFPAKSALGSADLKLCPFLGLFVPPCQFPL